MSEEKEAFPKKAGRQAPGNEQEPGNTLRDSSGEDISGDASFPDEDAVPAMHLRDLASVDIDWIKHTKVIMTIASVVVLLVLSATVLGIYDWDWCLIADGLTLNGVSIGHLTRAQAQDTMEDDLQNTLNRKVQFVAGDKKIEISLSDLGLSANLSEALQKAYAVGRTGSLPAKLLAKLKASTGQNLTVPLVWDETRLTAALKARLAFLEQPAADASYKIENNTMVITQEKIGRTVDFTALLQKVKKSDLLALPSIDVPIRETHPTLDAAYLTNLRPTGLIAKYSTGFDPSQVNRTHNLTLAAQALNGTLLKPGESFSFNDRVGPRSAEAGYRDALIIANGQFVPGLGGGVCQVSTTLYNAVLLADLSVTERTNHSLSIAYAPLGQDATVAYGNLDLKFRNDSGGYLLLRSQVNGDTLTFSLYGKVVPGKTVTITDNIETVFPPEQQHLTDLSLPRGVTRIEQAGQPGYYVTATRIVKVNGITEKTEKLPSSRYQALPRVVAAGPAQ